MFQSIYIFLLVLKLIPGNTSYFQQYCLNGRPALSHFDMTTFRFMTSCPNPGQACYNKVGKCTEQHLCCPRTLKMSSKSRLYDRVANIEFIRIGEKFKNYYGLYEINLLSNRSKIYDQMVRWDFFDKTLRDLYEMPDARFWYPTINCLLNKGISYAFIPLNATSVTSNISAMTILTRKFEYQNSIYVCYIATRKEHRRQGLGTRLLQQIIQRALDERKKNQINSVVMHANTLNTAALKLYERCGWRCYEYLPGYLDHDPYHATNHAYTLKLNLNNIRNLTGFCLDPNAIIINQSDNVQSIQKCGRTPIDFN